MAKKLLQKLYSFWYENYNEHFYSKQKAKQIFWFDDIDTYAQPGMVLVKSSHKRLKIENEKIKRNASLSLSK